MGVIGSVLFVEGYLIERQDFGLSHQTGQSEVMDFTPSISGRWLKLRRSAGGLFPGID